MLLNKEFEHVEQGQISIDLDNICTLMWCQAIVWLNDDSVNSLRPTDTYMRW